MISVPARKWMDRFSITRSGNEVVVDVGTMHKEDKDRAGWDAAVLRL